MIIPKTELELRIKKLREIMENESVDVFFTGAGAKIDSRGMLRYFFDYFVPVFEEYMVVVKNGPVIAIPHDAAGARYAEQCTVVDEIYPIPTGCQPGKFVGDIIKKYTAKKIGVANLSGMSYTFVKSLLDELASYEILNIENLIWDIRKKKSELEIELTKKTVEINELSFNEFLKNVKASQMDFQAYQKSKAFTDLLLTEEQYWMVGKKGAAGFWTNLHRFPEKFEQGDLISVVTEHSGPGGHWGEVSNLISIGEPNSDVVKAQAALAEAQNEAFKHIKPGNTIGQMADAAQRVLEDLGYLEKLTPDSPARYLGHSQGVDVFEPPVIVSGNEEIMEEGMRLNFHPSASLSDGAKISYCVCYLVTKDGGIRLTNLSDEIYIV